MDLYHWEVYIASQYLHDPGGVAFTSPHLDVNYGAALDLQLHAIAPIVTDRPNDGRQERCYSDTELGAKYRDRGLGNGRARFFLPVWIQKSCGPWTTYGGGSYWHNPGEGNRD